jgi:hypothetical protein
MQPRATLVGYRAFLGVCIDHIQEWCQLPDYAHLSYPVPVRLQILDNLLRYTTGLVEPVRVPLPGVSEDIGSPGRLFQHPAVDGLVNNIQILYGLQTFQRVNHAHSF